MSGDPSSLQTIALGYYDLGLAVIPLYNIVDGACTCRDGADCTRPGKHPRIAWKRHQRRRLPRAQVEQYWERWPNANIGIVTGAASGVVVLDLDGEEGVASLEQVGLALADLPVTPVVRTGGGGYHYYFVYDDTAPGTATGVLPNVDIRSDGGISILPPSVHIAGTEYSWVKDHGIDLPFASFDWSYVARAESVPNVITTNAPNWFLKLLRGVQEPGRNEAATRLAGRYIALGLTEEEVYLLLRGWNAINDPPLPDEELRRSVRSIWGKEHAPTDIKERTELMAQISTILKVTLLDARRISGDEPKVILDFREGTAMMTTGQLLSPKMFQQTIAEATKFVPRRFSAKTVPTHDRLSQMILMVCQDVDAGAEATRAGELMLLIGDYLSGNSLLPHIRSGDEAPLRGPFVARDRVWINAVDLLQRAMVNWSRRTTLSDLAQRMRASDMIREEFPIPGGGTRAVWGIQLGRVPYVQIDADEDATTKETTIT